jgi:hypothetical protein
LDGKNQIFKVVLITTSVDLLFIAAATRRILVKSLKSEFRRRKIIASPPHRQLNFSRAIYFSEVTCSRDRQKSIMRFREALFFAVNGQSKQAAEMHVRAMHSWNSIVVRWK